MNGDDVAELCCPDCQGELTYSGTFVGAALAEGSLRCSACSAVWPVAAGLPRLFRETEVTGSDRIMRWIYDAAPRLHNPSVRYLLPLLQHKTERALRAGYLRRMELRTLRPSGGAPVRLLEVGVGAGANLPLLARELAGDVPFEIWGVDLSAGMLSACRRELAGRPIAAHVRLAMGDAHRLPFRGSSFDRVFHVGGIGNFRDPGAALREMARVARPGTPIVVVDEQLDPALAGSRYYRTAFRLVSVYGATRAPVDALPPGAVLVAEEQVSPFYYCLTFRTAERPGPLPVEHGDDPGAPELPA